METPQVRVLLFSWEDVLLDTRATREAFLVVQWQSFLDELLHIPARSYVDAVLRELSAHPGDPAAAYSAALESLDLPTTLLPYLLRDLHDHRGGSPRLFPGALNTLRHLSHALKTSLVATGREAELRESVRQSGLEPYFHVIEIADTPVTGTRTTPETIKRALHALGTPADRAVFIGSDLEGELAAARLAGTHTVWKRQDGAVPGHPDGVGSVIDDIRDLPHELRDLAGMPAG